MQHPTSGVRVGGRVVVIRNGRFVVKTQKEGGQVADRKTMAARKSR